MYTSNPNKLLLKEKVSDIAVCSERGYFHNFGILLTVCYPCKYYSGPIEQDPIDHSWFPSNNETSLFHRTEDEALNALIKQINLFKRYLKDNYKRYDIEIHNDQD